MHTADGATAGVGVGPQALIPFMKVDAQGFDTLVLRGAKRLLAERRIEVFVFEFTPFLMPGRQHEAVSALEWLESTGHVCVPCNTRHTAPFQLTSPTSIRSYVGRFSGEQMTSYDDIACRPTRSR